MRNDVKVRRKRGEQRGDGWSTGKGLNEEKLEDMRRGEIEGKW